MSVLGSHAPYSLRSGLWSLRRMLGLSPTQRVFRELERRGVRTREMAAVEIFAGTGFLHAIDYCGRVNRLEAWEINPSRAPLLLRNLPGVSIRITDSFQEVRCTAQRFGIIVVDNTISTFGNGHVEHFDLFPDLFRIAADSAVMILNVCPRIPETGLGDSLRMTRRSAFYRTVRPEDVPVARMVEVYADLIRQNGFRLDWSFSVRRSYRTGIHYLVAGMTRSGATPAIAS